MTDAQFRLLTTVFLVVYAIASPFAGFLADRLSRSRVILVSLLAWSLVTLATAWVTTYDQLLLSRVALAGFGGWFADRHDWTYAYQVFGWIGLGHAVLVLLFLKDLTAPAGPVAQAPRVSLSDAFAHLSPTAPIYSCWVTPARWGSSAGPSSAGCRRS